MDNHDLSLPDLLRQQMKVLSGGDTSVLDAELKLFSQRERREDADSGIIPFPNFTPRPPISAQRRKAA